MQMFSPLTSRACRLACRAFALGLLAAVAVPLSSQAQIVRGQVVDSLVGTPIAGGVVVLIDQDDVEVSRTLTDEDGLFLLRAPGAGQYRLRAERDGYRQSDFPAFDLAADGMLAYRLLVPALGVAPVGPEPAQEEAETIIAQICHGSDIPGLPVVVGIVRDAVTRELVGQADVILTWSPVPTELAGLVNKVEDTQGTAWTGTTGFFAVCGAPIETRIDIHAEFRGLTSEFMSLRFEVGGVLVGAEFVPMTSRLWRQDFDILPREQRTASISGTITDTSGRGISSAQVKIVGTNFTARANLSGEFTISGLPPGRMRVDVELVGYRPSRTAVELVQGESLRLEDAALQLTPVATELAPVIEAQRFESRPTLAEFERRRSTTTGSFTTRQEFMEQGNPQKTTDVLRRMSGIRVRPGTGLEALPWIITSARGAGNAELVTGGVCFPLVYLDQQLIGTTGNVVVDKSIPIEQIEAIEWYGSVAGMPPEFYGRGAVCGALVFWTR